MCGIAGYVDFSSAPDPKTLRAMTDSIIYRGPDSSGEFFSKDKKVGLGARRLSIIDLVTGDQPISNEDGTVTVVYNGEIYNYLPLREELLKKGHKFRTKSDTETLVHLYEEYGEEMPKKLNGMFAFAIWDEEKGKLFIARDRTGIKPLYYFQKGKYLVFGSEVKTLFKFPPITKKIDPWAFGFFCYFGYLPGEYSIFGGVKKLLPGHSLSFSKSGIKIRKYWELVFDGNYSETPLDELLRNAVVSQLQADVPVGVFLSGGLDSSLISYYITEGGRKMKSFSISFEEESFDEGIYARMVAKRLGTEHREETFKVSEVPDLFKELTEKLDEPFSDPSILPTYKVSKLARKYVKVALSGDGGDELFGGYPTYKGQLIAEVLKYTPKDLIDLGTRLLSVLPNSFENYPKKTLATIFARALKMEAFERQIYMMRTFFLGENLLAAKPNLQEVRKLLPDIDRIKSPSLKAQAIDFYTYLRDDFLVKTDRASMYNSLEVRVPYLDNEVIDFAFSTQKRHVGLFKTKMLLRELAEKYVPEVAQRPKKGFGIPTAKWFRGPLKEFAYTQIQNKDLYEYIDKEKIEKVWKNHQEMKENNGGVLWMLVMLSGWLNNWV